METGEYANLAAEETKSFWHRARREIAGEAIDRHISNQHHNDILDIGCGTGGNFSLLAEYGSVNGVDFSPEAIKFAERFPFTSLQQADATQLSFPNGTYSLVTAFDVLEHISLDTKAMGEIWRVLKPGGVLVATVPAFQWLWTEHDVALHHCRRYTKQLLTDRLSKAGFIVEEASYYMMFGMFVHLARKVLGWLLPKKNHAKTTSLLFPWYINNILLAIARIEKKLIRISSLPFGTSIIIVARKPLS